MSNFIQELTHIIIDRVNDNLKKDNNKVVGLQLVLSWYDRVSNSHSAPVGKPTNGGRLGFLPTGYPGWSGRVWIRYDKKCFKGWGGSDPIRGTGLHTGTGGFGTYSGPWTKLAHSIFDAELIDKISLKKYNDLKPVCHSWDCRVFAEDFPEILELYQMDKCFDLLANGGESQREYSYCWEDPETAAADKLLIERFESMENKDEILT